MLRGRGAAAPGSTPPGWPRARRPACRAAAPRGPRGASRQSTIIRCSAFGGEARSVGAPAFQVYGGHRQVPLVRGAQATAARVVRWLVENERLLVVAASTMIMSVSHTALRPVLPVFAKGFGVGAAAVGTTISVYAIARLMMNVPAGILGDRHGRKPLLVWGPAITALGMVGCGLAGTFRQLLLWRWVTGLGSALQMAGAQLYLADISASSNRARTLGTNQAAALVGGLLGPALGGVLADCVGIRAPFTFTGAAAACAALYGLLRLPETRRAASPEPQPQPAPGPQLANNAVPAPARVQEPALAAAAAAPQTSGAAQRRAAPAGPRPAAGEEAASAAGEQRRREARPSWRALLASRDFRAIALVNAVMFATANGSRSVLMPLLAVQGFGMKTTFLGLIFAGMAVVSLVGIMPAAAVADGLGRKWAIVPSCLGLAAALALMALAGGVHGFLLAAGVYAISHACVGATPAAYAADVMPQNVSGLGLGIYRCAGDLGLMVGPALLGWISDITSVQTAMLANAAVLALAVAYFGLTAQEPRHVRAAAQQQQPQPAPA